MRSEFQVLWRMCHYRLRASVFCNIDRNRNAHKHKSTRPIKLTKRLLQNGENMSIWLFFLHPLHGNRIALFPSRQFTEWLPNHNVFLGKVLINDDFYSEYLHARLSLCSHTQNSDSGSSVQRLLEKGNILHFNTMYVVAQALCVRSCLLTHIDYRRDSATSFSLH